MRLMGILMTWLKGPSRLACPSSFSDKDKIGTIQPHDDALVVTLGIGGYNVKRVMID